MNEVIKVKDLCFTYNSVKTLDNINFAVNKGDFLGIIGENGAGKSTLLKLITKSLKYDTGEITILGDEIDAFDSWNKIGYLSQKVTSFNLSFPATVEEIVGANLYKKVGLFKRIKREHRQMISEALKKVGMDGYEKRMIGELSGGQQQRVFIARMIVNEPEVLLLDEPTVGIDAKSQEIILSLVKKFNEENGVTVLIISHDMQAIEYYCHRVLVMSNKSIYEKTRKTEDFK
jgi:zinc transport system ATP-binding protein